MTEQRKNRTGGEILMDMAERQRRGEPDDPPPVTTPGVLSPAAVGIYREAVAAGLPVGGEMLLMLIRSHERLRAMFAEACVRIDQQSDALSRQAEAKPDEP